MEIYTRKTKKPIEEQPFFLGERNVARLDIETDRFVESQYYSLRDQIWFPSDYDMSKDNKSYALMNQNMKNKFIKNLKFQTFADSVATRGVSECFTAITTNPILENFFVLHSYTESIHSESYSHVVKSLPIDSKKEFDEIIQNDHINKRAELVVNGFNKLIKENAKFTLKDELEYDEEEHIEAIMDGLIVLNILEGCLFESSFIMSYAFAEENFMLTSAKIISKINQDETSHLIMSIYLINKLKKEGLYKKVFNKNKSKYLATYKEAQDIDLEWVDYVFEDGDFGSLSKEALTEHILYNTDLATKRLGLGLVNSGNHKSNIDWLSKYQNPAEVQTALNEMDGSNYLLGIVDKKMEESDWNYSSLEVDYR